MNVHKAMKKVLTLLIGIGCTLTTYSQIVCGTDELHQERYAQDARYRMKMDRTEAFLERKGITNYKTVSTPAGDEFHVPCVVHVIHTGGAVGSNYNPSTADITAFIAQINNGFANTYDQGSVPGTFNSEEVPIRFFLALRDEACATTTAINRINFSSNATYNASGVRSNTAQPGVPDATVKALEHWDDLNYYNIYIVNKINGEDGYTTMGGFVAGYAQYPSMGGSPTDGMVVLAYETGLINSVFIHEMGHSFNLQHTFDGGTTTTCPSNANCNNDNDGICDTEPIRQTLTCNPSGINPCTGNNFNIEEAQFNYLSYNGCTDRFTPGQETVMMSTLNNIRTSYKNSAAIDPPPAVLATAITPPTFGLANVGNNNNMGPKVVAFNSIEHTSDGYSFEGAGDVFYVDQTCNQATTVIAGQAYNLDVITESNPQKVNVYIDYNNDGVFGTTAPELVMASTGTYGPFYTHNTTVTPPPSATLNTPLRMRVIADFFTSTMSPNMQLAYGQAEDFTVTVLGAPLPVLWRSVAANLNQAQNIVVSWSTEMETNNARFEIEKSKNGRDFYKIGELAGAVNSSLPKHYSFVDVQNLRGYNYYRIKQVDIDGKYSYSKVVYEMINSRELSVTIYPNPTTANFRIEALGIMHPGTINQVNYSVTDINGRTVVQRKKVQTHDTDVTLDISLDGLNDGLYFVHLSLNGVSKIYKILKEN